MKRISIILLLTVALCLAFVGSAYANFGPHGGYVNDTDSCAGCHRAHTSFSTVGWTDWALNQHTSALLVGNAQTMTQFCDACHGDTAPGASTNVVSGVFDSGPSAAGTTGNIQSGLSTPHASGSLATSDTGYPGDGSSVITAYETSSTFGAPLNGGGFTRMPDPYQWQTNATLSYKQSSSAHKMDVVGPLWGGNASAANWGGTVGLTCTDCHDPHGNSNYRLLKANVNGTPVGGYLADGLTPDPFVVSNETGYPVPNFVTNRGGGVVNGLAPNGGWLKHEDGAAQMADYRPNYTNTSGTSILAFQNPSPGNPVTKSMSVWCAACHTDYNAASAGTPIPYNYGANLALEALPALGSKDYHRHAIDLAMVGQANAGHSLTEAVVSDPAWVPLENPGVGTNSWDYGHIGCLTCHRAHGSSVDMTGWASAHLSTMTVDTTGTAQLVYMPVRDTTMGVDPAKGAYNNLNNQGSSNLLRANNRGVCERCHNK